MYEITKPSSDAPLVSAVQSTTRLSEIRHGAQFAVDGPAGIPSTVQDVAGLLGAVFVFEARVHVSDQVVVVVVAHDEFFELAARDFAQLAPHVFVERVKVVLQLRSVEGFVDL